MKWLRDLMTGVDGVTHDLGRWSWAGSWAAVVSAAGANWIHGATIDLMQLGGALCAVATAHGAALFLKRDTEPKA